jgi:hypothetical protein
MCSLTATFIVGVTFFLGLTHTHPIVMHVTFPNIVSIPLIGGLVVSKTLNTVCQKSNITGIRTYHQKLQPQISHEIEYKTFCGLKISTFLVLNCLLDFSTFVMHNQMSMSEVYLNRVLPR